MAKNKEDFYNDGFREYGYGFPRPLGTSWQQIAMAKGWIAAQKESEAISELYFTKAAKMGYSSSPVQWKMPKAVQKFKDTKNAVESHIAALSYAAGLQFDQNRIKYKRYVNKIKNLHIKHAAIL